jgi:hypothetical protein
MSSGGLYVCLLPVEFPRDDVTSIFFLGYTAAGEDFEIEGQMWRADPEDYRLSIKFAALTEKLLEMGKIKPHPADVRTGFAEILNGMEESKDGKVSGKKLVYRIADEE